MVFILSFTVSSFFSLNPPAAVVAQQYANFEHISIADGLSQSTVSFTIQDHEGYIWFGTREGFNRYAE
jgi:ligand-binding sensor domain-containing protein